MKIERKVRSFTLYSILFILFTCLYLPSTAYAEEGDAKKGTTQNPYIITTDVTYPPFEFQNDKKEYIGIDADVIKAIAKDQGFEIEFRPLTFSAGLQALETNQVDGMIAAMSITPEREESFDFSDPYYEAGTVMAIAEDNKEIQSYEDLEGKTIAVKVGTTGATFVEKLQEKYNINVNQFEDSATMYEDVVAGHSDAVFDDYPVMAYAIQQGLKLNLPLDPEKGDVYGFAVNKDENAELLKMFNTGLVNIKENGTYDKIIDQYLGDDDEGSQSSFFSLIQNNWRDLMTGLGKTLLIAAISFAIALILGVVLGFFAASPYSVLKVISRIYVTIMRGLPLLVLAFFIYFSVPQLLNIKLTAFIAGVATLTLSAAAYVSEQVRGGIEAVSGGQLEAARSLGLSYQRSMIKVVIPQAIKIMIPSLINQFVITLKDTSILSIIGIVELTQAGKIIIARTYSSGSMWIIVGVIYILIITFLTWLSTFIERKITNG